MTNLIKSAGLWLRKFLSPEAELESLGLFLRDGGRSTYAGKYVDETNAIQATAVYACVRFVADITAMVPRKLHQRTGDVTREASEHPLYDLLKNRPNPYMSAFSFWQTLTGNFAIYGRAFAKIQRNRDRKIIALWPMPSWSVFVDASKTIPRFKHRRIDGTDEFLTPDEVFWLRGFSLDGYTSLSPVDVCRQAIGLALTTEEFVARYFGNGAWPGLVLEYPQNLKDQAVDRIRASFEGAHGGVANAHRVGIAEGGVKIHKIDINAEQSQLLESRNFQIEEICRIWRVPPHVIQHLLRSTFGNIEHQGIEVVKYTIAPNASCIEGAIDNQLLDSKDRQNGYYCKHNLDAIERGDFASRTQGIVTLTNNGILAINEGRRLFDLNPVEGGDENRVQMQNVPITAPLPDATGTGAIQ